VSDVKRKGPARADKGLLGRRACGRLGIARDGGLAVRRWAGMPSGPQRRGAVPFSYRKNLPSGDGEKVTGFPLHMLEWAVTMRFQYKWYQSMRRSWARRIGASDTYQAEVPSSHLCVSCPFARIGNCKHYPTFRCFYVPFQPCLCLAICTI